MTGAALGGVMAPLDRDNFMSAVSCTDEGWTRCEDGAELNCAI